MEWTWEKVWARRPVRYRCVVEGVVSACLSWRVDKCNSLAMQMLWNWYTIDACFLARSWHVRSNGIFAASCIGVVLLVISLELLRRTQREFDRYLSSPYTRLASETGSGSGEPAGVKGSQNKVAEFGLSSSGPSPTPSKLKVWQQVVRSLLYMLQFAVGYFVMLLAMYYNGKLVHDNPCGYF